MAIKKVCEKIILIILTISILLSFMATPVSNAGLKLKDDEFYYSGTTEGSYVVSQGIFSWLIDNLGKIADWLFGLITMIVRMPIIGWVALIEKLLTWSVEQTAGVSNNGGLVVDSSDVTAIGDSSGNLTVQAIVYNRVPLFDINFFNLETDKTVSPTGQVLRCEKCKKDCKDCCSSITEDNIPDGDEAVCSDCDCNCSNCQQYLANWQAEKPLVIQIREFVAMWYTIIRLLSMIAMLIALLGIGIKMALSTVASEKAVYKRMLVDWVVGMIILFAMHYLIYFIIIINETLVDTVAETANSINKTQIQFVNSGRESKAEENTQIVSDDEIEINLYEEIRSRAYDARLSIGLSGMIMYVTLVYFAVRYSIVYLKRYLTVIVLTLMAPPLGVAYALQKALTGKSSSLKTWWTEFVMTVIIQIVHALIYAVFISTALALSMESVAGMVVALIFMNFSLKAEKMFRQIFKMGDGDSLAGRMAESGDADKLQSNFKGAVHLAQSAKPIAGAMMNTPMVKGIKTAGKVGLTTGVAIGNGIAGLTKGKKNKDANQKDATSDDKDKSTDSVKTDSSTNSTSKDSIADNIEDTDTGDEVDTGEQEPITDEEEREQQALLKEGGESLRKKAVDGILTLQDPNATTEEKANAKKSVDNYVKYQQLMHSDPDRKGNPHDAPVTSKEIFAGHVKKAINITNHYQVSGSSKLSNAYRTVFGTRHYDAKTGKMVYDGNGYFSQFNTENLLGLSKEDKKFIKTEAMKPLRGILGAMSFTIGLSTAVAHPGIGLAGMAGGAHLYNQAFRQPTGQKKYSGRYVNAKFPAATVQTAQQQLLRQAYSAIKANEDLLDSDTVRRVKENNSNLYNAILEDLKNGGDYSGIQLNGKISRSNKRWNRAKSGVSKATFLPKKAAKFGGLFNADAHSASMDAIDRYSLIRAKKETAAFEKESSNILKIAHQQEMEDLIKGQDEKLGIDQATIERDFLEDISKENPTDEKSRLHRYIENCEKLGFTYDKDNRSLSRRTIESTNFSGIGGDRATEVEKTIDVVMQDMYKISGKIDTSEAGIDKTIKLLNNRLRSEGLLDKKHSIEVLFKDKETVRQVVENKANIFNAQAEITAEANSSREKLEEAISKQKGFSEREQKLIQQIVLENGIQGADATKIMDKVSERIGMLDQGKKQPVNKNSRSKGVHKTNADIRKERKDKIKAIDDFLKVAESLQAPSELTAAQASKTVMESIESPEKLKKASIRKSHAKFKKVLQFIEESGDASLNELMDTTEGKVKNAKNGMQVDGEEFSKTEAETLQLLFDKMKEEVIFNQFTKDVLDQKDGQATIAAKRNLYQAKEEYLRAQKANASLTDEKIDQIKRDNAEFGIGDTEITDLIDGKTSAQKIVDKLSANDMQKVIDLNQKFMGIETDKSNYSAMKETEKKEAQSKAARYLEKKLAYGGLHEVEKARAKVSAANKKAILSGKIDINKQIDSLL